MVKLNSSANLNETRKLCETFQYAFIMIFSFESICYTEKFSTKNVKNRLFIYSHFLFEFILNGTHVLLNNGFNLSFLFVCG
jgi:hypothetical protein